MAARSASKQIRTAQRRTLRRATATDRLLWPLSRSRCWFARPLAAPDCCSPRHHCSRRVSRQAIEKNPPVRIVRSNPEAARCAVAARVDRGGRGQGGRGGQVWVFCRCGWVARRRVPNDHTALVGTSWETIPPTIRLECGRHGAERDSRHDRTRSDPARRNKQSARSNHDHHLDDWAFPPRM